MKKIFNKPYYYIAKIVSNATLIGILILPTLSIVVYTEAFPWPAYICIGLLVICTIILLISDLIFYRCPKCGYIIKIDHHKPFDEPFEHLTFVDTNYSSCSEMILDLYLSNSDKF